MQKLNNQKGSLIIEIVLGILVLVALGFGFYEAHQASVIGQKVGSDTTVQHKKTQASTPPASQVQATNSSAGAPKYLDIPQLHVRFQLPSDVQDVVYVMSSDGMTAYLSSTSLMNLQRKDEPSYPTYCDAGVKPVPDPLGGITETSQGTGSKRVFNGPQATCSNNSDVNKLETSQLNSLLQAFDSTAVTY